MFFELFDRNEAPWTVRVQGQPASNDAPYLVVKGHNLMPLVARLIADARVQDIVVRPRIREVRAHILEPARTPLEKA
jgi:hypothetical protein